jgi:ubiquinone/menaquinone biosynthesis C-methylase UbiE
VDVGGAAGAYSLWLAEAGFDVHLVDASERLVREARQRSANAARAVAAFSVSDARQLPDDDESADAVLVMGPLYHLTRRADRLAALAEARRVLRNDGLVAVAAISRCASTLDGLARELTLDPRFVAIRDRDLLDGQHRNSGDNTTYFTTSYFHRPDDLAGELVEAGFDDTAVLGVEGPGWLMSDFGERWADPVRRSELLRAARVLEREPSILGASAHLIGLGWKRKR